MLPRPGMSPRKRGRKPKHYSEILFELGQRGISITKTNRNELPNGPPMPRGGGPGHHGHQHPKTPLINDPTGLNKQGNQSLQCPHCNKVLTTSVGLMYHIRLHTGEKPYRCDLCGKSFATSSHYHYHIRTHSGEKPYRCDFCGKMYTASGSLRLHLKSHLSRLSANVFGGLNGLPLNAAAAMEGMNGLNMFSRGLESMFGDKGGSEDIGEMPVETKFNIKQEIMEASDHPQQQQQQQQHPTDPQQQLQHFREQQQQQLRQLQQQHQMQREEQLSRTAEQLPSRTSEQQILGN